MIFKQFKGPSTNGTICKMSSLQIGQFKTQRLYFKEWFKDNVRVNFLYDNI